MWDLSLSLPPSLLLLPKYIKLDKMLTKTWEQVFSLRVSHQRSRIPSLALLPLQSSTNTALGRQLGWLQ